MLADIVMLSVVTVMTDPTTRFENLSFCVCQLDAGESLQLHMAYLAHL